ncbi:unnamed protein product, partial [Allacma fusca]
DKTQQRTFVALSASQSTPRHSRGQEIYENGLFFEREVEIFSQPDKTQQRTVVALSASQSTP